MVPWHVILPFLLVAQSLASSVITMSSKGRPVTDTRNDVTFEYVSTRTLPFVTISLLPVGRLRGDCVQLQGGHGGTDGHPGES